MVSTSRAGIMSLTKVLLVAFFIPFTLGLDFGLGPKFYREGEKVDLIVNKVESDHTQLPYSYYSLPFVCPADGTAKPVGLSLGEILKGDRKWESNYHLNFGIDMECARLCDLICKESVVTRADQFIRRGYVAHWEVDDLPGATTFLDSNKNKYYAAGFPLGFVEDDVSYIYNHFMLVIRIHRADHNPNLHTIVGFEVYPKSVSNEKCPGKSTNYKNFALLSSKKLSAAFEPLRIPYTYSVYWREDRSVEYESRWDMYYNSHGDSSKSKIHWFSFINSLVLLFLASLVVAIILFRVLKSDLESNPSVPINEADKTWRRLYSDVLRQPNFSFVLSVFTAAGIQMLVCTFGVILIFVLNAKLGVKSTGKILFDNNQGALFSFSIFFLICSGMISSYLGIIFHKILSNNPLNQQYSMKKQILLSILFCGTLPTIVLSVVLFINLFVWAKKSSNALPFGTIVVLLLLLFVIEIPLGIIGGHIGNEKRFDSNSFFIKSRGEKANNDTTSNRRLYWITNPFIISLVFGLIPFGVVYVELNFIFNSVWLEKTTFYHMYGFLLIAATILILLIAESTIIATYISLAVYNNPYWHWLSFNVGSSIGWYVLLYSIYYFFYVLNVREMVSILFYFAYMGLVSILIGVSGGAVGLISGLVFIRKIYGNIKLD